MDINIILKGFYTLKFSQIRRRQRYNEYVRSRFNADGDAIFMTDDVITTHDDVIQDDDGQILDDETGDLPVTIQGFDQDEPLILA